MMSGSVRVKGFASTAAGASAHGGTLVIDGDAALRCGISLKGGDIVVGGSVGSFCAFMAQAGRMVICGDAGDALGDSLYEAVIYVRGKVRSLGADARFEADDGRRSRAVRELLAGRARPRRREFQRVASAQESVSLECRCEAGILRIHGPKQRSCEESAGFDRALIDYIQRAAATGLYEIRGLGAKRHAADFDDLVFLGASLSRYPLEGYREKCSTKTVLGTRFATKPIELAIADHHRRHELRRAVGECERGAGPRRDASSARRRRPATAA